MLYVLPATTDATQKQAEDFVLAWERGQEVFTLATSGSTGTPKSIEIHRRQMEASAAATTAALGLERGKKALIGINPAFIGGKMALVRGLQLGWDLYVTEPSARALADWPFAEPPYHASMVPLQLGACIADPILKDRLAGMHSVLIGGAPLAASIEAEAEHIPHVALYQTFGMTETVSHIALRRLNGESKTNVYTLLPGHEGRMDERGCLAVCGPITDNAWVQSHDRVTFVGPTQFTWLGRTDFTINSGGIKLQPEVLESELGPLLHQFGYTAEYYVIGREDVTLGQKVVLVLLASNVNIEELRTYLAQHLPPYHAPRAIEVVSGFTRTATGKIIRK